MLGLAAENGFFYRWPTVGQSEDKWEHLLENCEENLWRESVRDIMNSYASKTDGSFIEDRESMIIWNFKDSDPEFGSWQSKELRNHIETFFSEQQI
jgi:trehalose 6-phosphate synthase/phosphatase